MLKTDTKAEQREADAARILPPANHYEEQSETDETHEESLSARM